MPHFASFLSTGLDVLEASDRMSVANLLSRPPPAGRGVPGRRAPARSITRIEVVHFPVAAVVFGRRADDFRIRWRSGSLRWIDQRYRTLDVVQRERLRRSGSRRLSRKRERGCPAWRPSPGPLHRAGLTGRSTRNGVENHVLARRCP
jgi:hypothetical protein